MNEDYEFAHQMPYYRAHWHVPVWPFVLAPFVIVGLFVLVLAVTA